MHTLNQDLQAFHPQAFSSSEDERLHCSCPVRAPRHYVDRMKALRKSNQLCISWADSHKGKSISSQSLSHWGVEAIILGYNSMGLGPPEGLRATSWEPFMGVRSIAMLRMKWGPLAAIYMREAGLLHHCRDLSVN